jgi:hypothetical protein
MLTIIISTDSSKMELQERDRNAIAYTKSLLEEGDTMVYIMYPANSQIQHPTGFDMPIKVHRVHSERLLQTGSTKFQELFSDWSQAKMRRRKGHFNNLPPGVMYILDLTPPDEGDEAVELTTELSCSTGIRHWYSAERRCNVSVDLCGGKDEIAKPKSKPKQVPAQLTDLVEALADLSTETRLMHDLSNSEGGVPGAHSLQNSDSSEELHEREDRELKEAVERSTPDFHINRAAALDVPTEDRYQKVEEVLEYCPIRHRAGIERLRQFIEGKEPRLDSAPKVWTLLVLAKHFDCTNVVVSQTPRSCPCMIF